MTCGIYAIVCDKTWRSYVGQSVNIRKRYLAHIQLLKRGRHNNSEFQSDFNLYGEESFHMEILEQIENERDLGKRENYWIDFGENLYNQVIHHNTLITELEKIRLFLRIIKSETDECWEWKGKKTKSGYGRFRVTRNDKRIWFAVHRVVYFLENPEDDQLLLVRHKCNNKICCNPKHLIIGTYSDNKKDISYDENNIYKLNWKIVSEIRDKYILNPNISNKELLSWVYINYNLEFDRTYLRKVCRNEKWVDKNYIPPKSSLKIMLSKYEKDLIINCYKNGYKGKKILEYVNTQLNIPIAISEIWKIIRDNKKENQIG
jgi:group I intron endonuclease